LLEARAVGHSLPENAWFARLRREGYAIRVYQTDWLDLCAAAEVDACYTYPIYSVNAVQRSGLSTGQRLRILLGKLDLGRPVALPGPLASFDALDRFQADIAKAPRSVAYVVHLLIPHHGYLFQEDCSLADPAEWEDQPTNATIVYPPEERLRIYGLYLPQLICTQKRMDELFAVLKGLGVYDDATIIVHGDHGSRIGQRTIHAPPDAQSARDLLDHHSTLFAVKAPRGAPGAVGEPGAIQELFADMFLGGSADAIAQDQVFVRNEVEKTFVWRQLLWPGDANEAADEIAAANTSGAAKD
jgi:hypothetical protein